MFLLQNTFIHEIRFTFRNSFLICLTDVFRQNAKQVTCITLHYSKSTTQLLAYDITRVKYTRQTFIL